MSGEIIALPGENRQQQRPSERAARFILGICGWIRDIFTTVNAGIPHSYVFLHQGDMPAAGKAIRYRRILLAEDDPGRAREFITAIRNYYVCGTVRILVAHGYEAAITFFENEDIELVIMDADLDDEEGDGVILTRKFLGENPGITILANSSSKISSLKLTGCGACESLGKSTEQLMRWLAVNDPVGSGR